MYMYVRVYMYSTCIMIFTDFSRLACTALFNCYVHVCMYVYMYMSITIYFSPSYYMYSNLNNGSTPHRRCVSVLNIFMET